MKTSVLSTKWRYKYATRSSLVFDDSLLRERPNKTNKFLSIINHVLLVNSGPIHKFELHVGRKLPIHEIEKWILFLSRRHLKVFVFSSTKYVDTPFGVSSSLFSCQSLTDLDLGRCSLLPPSTFGGFKKLKSLGLYSVVVCEAALERLISSSPVLERLTVSYCKDIHRLCVNAPNIQHLTITGCFIHLSLGNTTRLTVFSIETYDEDVEAEDVYFKNLLSGMPRIQRLDIGRRYLHVRAQCTSIFFFF